MSWLRKTATATREGAKMTFGQTHNKVKDRLHAPPPWLGRSRTHFLPFHNFLDSIVFYASRMRSHHWGYAPTSLGVCTHITEDLTTTTTYPIISSLDVDIRSERIRLNDPAPEQKPFSQKHSPYEKSRPHTIPARGRAETSDTHPRFSRVWSPVPAKSPETALPRSRHPWSTNTGKTAPPDSRSVAAPAACDTP